MSRLKLPIAALLLILVSTFAAAQIQDDWQDVDRIVAVGDLHGDYDSYIEVLRGAKLINRRGNWIGGATHLVQLGDVPDRGPDTHRIIAHLQKLEAQAQDDGGKVHVLIGNHEALNILGDLRYVHPGEYEAQRSPQARQLQDDYYQQFVTFLQSQSDPPVIDAAHRAAWNKQYPLGYVEHRVHWAPTGKYGSWVLQHNSVIRINRTLFVHGGLGPGMLGATLAQINKQIRAELRGEQVPEQEAVQLIAQGAGPESEGTQTQDSASAAEQVSELLADATDGPLWYRGLAQHDEAEEAMHVQALLEHFDADRIVIGHTPGFGTVLPRFDSRVLVVDTGISAYYGSFRASMLMEEEKLFTLQQGESVPIPANNTELPAYLRRILELEPRATNLQTLLHNLENPAAPAAIPETPN